MATLSPQQIQYMSRLAQAVGPVYVGDQDIDYSLFVAPEGAGESTGVWVRPDGTLDDGSGKRPSQEEALEAARALGFPAHPDEDDPEYQEFVRAGENEPEYGIEATSPAGWRAPESSWPERIPGAPVGGEPEPHRSSAFEETPAEMHERLRRTAPREPTPEEGGLPPAGPSSDTRWQEGRELELAHADMSGREAASLILDAAAYAPDSALEGLAMALGAILSSDERPAAELIAEARSA